MSGVIQQVGLSIAQAVCQPEGGGGGYTPSGAVEFVAGTIVSNAGSVLASIDVAVPAGTQESDFLVVSAFSRNSYVGMPEGGGWDVEWTYQLAQFGDPSIGGGNDRSELWSKVAGAEEPENFTCSITDGGSGRAYVILCAAFRNASGITTFSQTGGTAAPSVNAEDKDMLLGINGTALDTGPAAVVPATMTQIQQAYEAGSDVGGAAAYEAIVATGATGTRTWTQWDVFNLTGNVVIQSVDNV